MFLLQADSIHALQALANDYKFWLSAVAVVIAGYKAFEWVKQIRTKDLIEIHGGIKELKTSIDTLSTKLDSQTTSVVGELKELRSDFRTFYIPQNTPLMMPVRSKAKRTPAKRKKAAPKKTQTDLHSA